MKLASLKHGRDGRLFVVSRDLTRAVDGSAVAPTLQAALDDWPAAEPRLQEIANALEAGRIAHIHFDPKTCASPLPRSFGWVDGSAYVNHVQLVRRARGAELPASFWTDPLMYRGGSDGFWGPCDPILIGDEAWGVDLEAEVAVITGQVARGATPVQAKDAIKLLMLVNDTSLRNLIPAELAKGFGFLHGKAPTAFSPVAVTPDELAPHWDGTKLNLPLSTYLNGRLFGNPNAGVDMDFDFPSLIAHAAKTRPLAAGTIIAGGAVSNKNARVGASCIAELRTLETILSGRASTPFLKFGDHVRIEMTDGDGRSIFGAIEQRIRRADGADGDGEA